MNIELINKINKKIGYDVNSFQEICFYLATEIEEKGSIKKNLESLSELEFKEVEIQFKSYLSNEKKTYHDKSITCIIDILRMKNNFIKTYKSAILDDFEHEHKRRLKLKNKRLKLK